MNKKNVCDSLSQWKGEKDVSSGGDERHSCTIPALPAFLASAHNK